MFDKPFWCFSTSLLTVVCLIINCPTALADQSNPAASATNNQIQVTQPSTNSTSSTNGLVQQNKAISYYQNGIAQTGWQHINNNWYYFNYDGNARQGWQSINNRWYYFNQQHAAAVTGEQHINNNWYYFDEQNAWANTGWQYVNGSWHYYDPQNAWAKTGWYQSKGGNWYYFDPNTSKALTGWQSINNHRYYFDPHNAWAVRKWNFINNQWYYFDPTNTWQLTGWQKINGQWYYLDSQKNSAMVSGLTNINGQHYYFDASGHLQNQTGLDSNQQLRIIQDDSIITVGQTIKDDNGQSLVIDNNGVATPKENGLVKIGNIILDYQNGSWATGWQTLNGHHYYFDTQSRLAQTGWLSDQDHWYYFNQQGQTSTGWQQINGRWYYFDVNDANALSGWQKINNHWYYFDPTNAWALTGWFQSSAGNWYYFDTQNAWADTGWQLLNGTWYYFDPDNAWMDLNQTLNYNWQQIMGSYWNSSAIAIQLQRNGAIYSTTNNPGLRYETASTVKVAVLAMLLHQTGGHLNATQQDLATRMIRYSDNDATTTIVNNYLGGYHALQSLYNDLRMSQTSANYTWWGTTLTVPTDQLKLLHMIYLDNSNDYLNTSSKNYIKSLMGSVSAGQQWGISAGSNSYYLKNGWRPASDNGLWEVHSIGYLPDGINSYTIAIYTRNNRNYNWGVSYVEALARITKKIIG